MSTKKKNQALLEDCAKHNSFYKFFKENQNFWENCPVELIPTPWRKVESKNSLMFKVDDHANQAEVLKRIFGIENKVFEEKYKEAIGGDGQEKRKIMTLHSSSLLSLLCFYQVSETKPLDLSLGKGQDPTTFTKVSFEQKNDLSYAYKDTASEYLNSKSNIDVILSVGDDENPQKVLFLESKFSEYLHNGAVYNISKEAYEKIYQDLGLKDSNGNLKIVEYNNKDGKECYKMKACEGKSYLEGVKQMISHFMGACTYAALHPKTEVYLGSIVYQFEEKIYKDKFENYKNLFQGIMQELQRLLEKHNQCSNLHLVNNLLTYNGLFPENYLDPKVAEYYQLSNDKNTLRENNY